VDAPQLFEHAAPPCHQLRVQGAKVGNRFFAVCYIVIRREVFYKVEQVIDKARVL
jgi:hypothetical protein